MQVVAWRTLTDATGWGGPPPTPLGKLRHSFPCPLTALPHRGPLLACRAADTRRCRPAKQPRSIGSIALGASSAKSRASLSLCALTLASQQCLYNNADTHNPTHHVPRIEAHPDGHVALRPQHSGVCALPAKSRAIGSSFRTLNTTPHRALPFQPQNQTNPTPSREESNKPTNLRS